MDDRKPRESNVIEMDDYRKKEKRVADVLKGATPRRSRSIERGVAVRGDQNVVAGRDVNINTSRIVRTTIQPGPEHISPGQASRIRDLVHKAADLEVASGMSQRAAMSKWWSILKKHFHVTTYREIPRELGEEAIAWLRQRIAMNRPKARRANNPAWRTSHYTAIYARANELGLSKGELYALVYSRLGKRISSLKQLGEQNLEKLYRIVMGLNR